MPVQPRHCGSIYIMCGCSPHSLPDGSTCKGKEVQTPALHPYGKPKAGRLSPPHRRKAGQ
eukprot:1158749-Pelagomonas_calceolata.AAC.4